VTETPKLSLRTTDDFESLPELIMENFFYRAGVAVGDQPVSGTCSCEHS
jgi:hypothetical protein